MLEFFLSEKQIFRRQIFNDLDIRFLGIIHRLDMHAGKICRFRLDDAIHSDMLDKRQIQLLTKIHIIFTKGWSRVDDTSAFFCCYKIRRDYFPTVLMVLQILIIRIIIK